MSPIAIARGFISPARMMIAEWESAAAPVPLDSDRRSAVSFGLESF